MGCHVDQEYLCNGGHLASLSSFQIVESCVNQVKKVCLTVFLLGTSILVDSVEQREMVCILLLELEVKNISHNILKLVNLS